MDEGPERPKHIEGLDPDEDLWSEALWSLGLIGSIVAVIAVLAQFA